MLNPVLYTEKVLSDFLKYQLTTYPFADRDLYEQMRQLLSLEHTRNTPLFKGPYVSLSRIFQEGATVAQLVQENILHTHLQNLIPYPTLYGHQEKAIRNIQQGKPTLVSTGTGSGKTECFLYPIISHCLDLKDHSESEGITAVIVYPMNALAEDQLGRLRELLAGTGITFGMYVGKSPQKAADAPGKRLAQGASNQDYQTAIAKSRNKGKAETIYPPEERVSREEMRAKPPRILLTNIKQLELLLTRQQDVELFNNVQLQYLVFDEAHTFSGAAGAETACLIRRLKTFCQYQNPTKNGNPFCIATSATIADPEKGKAAGADFAARFFGVDSKTVTLVGEEYQQDTWQTIRTIPPSLGENATTYLKSALTLLDQIDHEATNTADTIKALLRDAAGYQIDINNWQESLYHYLTANELVYQLAQILTSPKSLPDLIQQLRDRLGRSLDESEILFWLSLGSASRCQSRPLLRPVIHGFVRGVSGAVVTFPKPLGEVGEQAQLWLSSEDVDQTGQDTLYRLPATSCSTCGQHYYVHHVGDFRFLNTDDAPRGDESKALVNPGNL
ncbi:DEAD/DEAH box helicase (plasmid) [Synechocystis sp. B12]|nr:DEAD/DEAH box helicase [Synechocystis sp. B12]